MSHVGPKKKNKDLNALSAPISGPKYVPNMTVLIVRPFMTVIWNGKKGKINLSKLSRSKKIRKMSPT
jgi:hypothetical protein